MWSLGSDSEDPNKDDIASNLRNKIDRYEKLLKRVSCYVVVINEQV